MPTAIDTHGLVLQSSFKYRGVLVTRVPVGYLRWMVNSDHPEAPIAKAEMDRRGAHFPTIEISGHAMDRASLRLRAIWAHTQYQDEGLWSWLSRVGARAWADGEHQQDEGTIIKVTFAGMKIVFADGEECPTMVSIMPVKMGKIDQLNAAREALKDEDL